MDPLLTEATTRVTAAPTDAPVPRREVLKRGLVGLGLTSLSRPCSGFEQSVKGPGGRWDGSNLVELAKLEPEGRFEGNRCWSATFSRDSSLLAVAGFREGGLPTASWLTVWDVDTWKRRSTWQIDDIRIHRLGFTPDGEHLIAAGLDGLRLIACEVASGKVRELHKNPKTGGLISQILFSPDGNQFLFAGEEGVMVWETDTWFRSRDVPGTRDQGYQLALAAPDPNWNIFGGWLYGVNHFGVVSLLINPRPLQKGLAIGEFPGWTFNRVQGVERPWFADNLACSRDGKSAAISTVEEDQRYGIVLYDIEKPEVWRKRVRIEHGKHGRQNYSMSFTPDSRVLASGGSDKAIRFWDAATGKELPSALGHKGAVLSLAWSPDRSKLASAGGADMTVKVWARRDAD